MIQREDHKHSICVVSRLQSLTFDGIVDLLDEQLQFHDQRGGVRVSLPRRVFLRHLKGAVHPVFDVEVVIQEFREIHCCTFGGAKEAMGVCSARRVRFEEFRVIEP